MSSPLTDAIPPGARPRRAASRFQPNLIPALCALVAAIAITVVLWLQLLAFSDSLGISGAGLTIVRIALVVIAAVALAVPTYGVRAVYRAFQARREAAADFMYDARITAEDSRNDVLYVVGLGLMAAIVAFSAFFLAANDGHVRDVLLRWDLIWTHSHTALLRGFWWNIRLFMVAQLIVMVWALLVAVVRQIPGAAFGPLRLLAIVYTDVFRGVPAIIVIYLIGFGFPLAGVEPFASMKGDGQIFWLGVFALVLVYGAYVAEVYRAGLEGVHWSQTAAARGLGLSQTQTLRFVVVPQAVRRILPPLLNDFVALQKDTALVSVLALSEILKNANILKSHYFNLSPVTGAAIAFLVITIPFTRFVDYLIRRDKGRTQAQ